MLTPFGLRTTLFIIGPAGAAVHGVNVASPSVEPSEARGTATPSVFEKLVPKTVVVLLQKTPKSKLSPTAPGPASRTI